MKVRLAKLLIGLGILGPLFTPFSSHILKLLGLQVMSATFYAPYMSISTGEQPPQIFCLGFVLVLTASNLLALNGYHAFVADRRRALSRLSIGLIVPVLLEAASVLRPIVLSYTAGAPRRYHYYYYAPDPISSNIADSFLPSYSLFSIAHAASLVFLLLGCAILFDESRQIEN